MKMIELKVLPLAAPGAVLGHKATLTVIPCKDLPLRAPDDISQFSDLSLNARGSRCNGAEVNFVIHQFHVAGKIQVTTEDAGVLRG